MGRTWSLIVVGVEAAGEPREDGHFDEKDDGVQQRLGVEASWLAIVARRGRGSESKCRRGRRKDGYGCEAQMEAGGTLRWVVVVVVVDDGTGEDRVELTIRP